MNNGLVLIVDDSPLDLSLLKCTLLALGLNDRQIRVTESSKEALWLISKATEGEMALVISDQEMPVYTGLELLAAIRAQASTSQVPFVLVTSRAKEVEIASAVASYELTACLDKPVCKDKLGQVLVTFCLPQ